MGLTLYAIGAFLFFPAKMTGSYYPFLLAYFILTCGLSFLETSANPPTFSRWVGRKCFTQAQFGAILQPVGSLVGMFVAMNFIQARLNPLSTAERANLSNIEFEAIKQSDLSILIGPYLAIGIVVLIMFLLILISANAKEWGQRQKFGVDSCTKKSFFSTELSRRRSCSVFLCRGTNHVLDIYHPIWYVCSWHRVWKSRPQKCCRKNTISGNDHFLHQSFHCYLSDEILPAREK